MNAIKHLRESLFQHDDSLIPQYAYGQLYRKKAGLSYDPAKLPKTHDNYGAKILLPMDIYDYLVKKESQ